jgi:hypothetical protein
MNTAKLIAGSALGALWLASASLPAFAQCYPGLACPDPGGQTKPDGGGGTGGGNARGETQGGGARTQVEYYFVGPVNPPDDWLALRTFPSDKLGSRIMKMPEGTLFRVTEKRGDWWFVQLRDGKSGWAHSFWIRCCKYLDE